MNEEEIRGKLLLPFLNDLGFDLSEISLEKSFSIRLGKSLRVIQGRSDILCKRNEKNLFIIELKNDLILIDQDDIEQGISYARLLTDNIAPFTIITNGKTTRIFDSISREELTGAKISDQSSYWKNGFTLSTDVDLRIRYEALKKFVSFSPENLKMFCENQVRDRMGPIIGDINNAHAKFVKELYVQRKGLQSAFDEFTASDVSTFGLVGPAGVGKTSAMCSLALQQLEVGFVFFYNAAIINKSPLDHISQDLNGVFSSRSESDNILKKLEELGIFLNKSIVIFIDAIDESINPNLAINLSEIAFAIKYLRRVKVCISCKLTIWNNILKVNGTPTHLFEELNKFHNPVSSAENCPGFLLEDFNDDEVISIIPLYKEVFDFKGQISEALLAALRNGFFLRIFSEVYSQKEVPEEINDKELIRTYIKKSLGKTDLGIQVGLRILSKIGEILINHNYTEWDTFIEEGIEVENILDKLQFSIEESIPEALFARNLLTKSNKKDSYNISFYYSKIRDYVICFHSYRLDQLRDSEFYDLLEKFYGNYIGQSAISFYIENASDSHRRTLIKFKSDKAFKYVTDYDLYLEENFKSFKEKFDPSTKGSIGIFLPKDSLKDDGYALVPINSESSSKVQYENISVVFLQSYSNNIFFQNRVKKTHDSHLELLTLDQNTVIRKHIFKQLKEIINRGKISMYSSDILLLEQVSTIVYFYFQKLGFKFSLKDYYLPRFDLIYPIDLEDIKDRIYKFRATEYFNRQCIDPKLREDKIDEYLLNKNDIPKFNVTGNVPPFEELFTIVEILLNRGYRKVQKHYLPCPDISISDMKISHEDELNFDRIQNLQFSERQRKLYIESFLKHFEACYKEFVEYAFPTFKDKFPFFTTLPHEYYIYMNNSNIHEWGYLGYRPSKSENVEVNFKELLSMDEIFAAGDVHIIRGFSLSDIFHSDYNHTIKTVEKINTPKVDDYCVLRSWVYKYLKDDIKTILEEDKE